MAYTWENPMAEFNFIQKYARYNPEKKRKETFEETIDVIFRETHDEHLMRNFPNVFESEVFMDHYRRAEELYKEGRSWGSQRLFQWKGESVHKHNLRGFNCGFTHINRPEVFAEMMYVLLTGCGAGFSIVKEYVDMMPIVQGVTDEFVKVPVADSIEGFADAVKAISNAYFNGGKFPVLDYSAVRPEGAHISGGFTAPGPKPLARAIENIRAIFNGAVGRKLKPIECYDIICHIADSVIAGSVRRSALICLFGVDDDEMIQAKTGNWFNENKQRARSNNSMHILRNNIDKEAYLKAMRYAKQWGEPAVVFTDSLEVGTNPCAEIGLWAVWQNEDGSKEYGWQFCNLCSINGKLMTQRDEFMDACVTAATLGTIQASYHNFPYLGEITEKIVKRDALLGVSITGIMNNPQTLLDPEVLQEGAHLVRATNKTLAAIMGINVAAACCTIKPEGNTSVLTNTGSGIHPVHARRYIRRIQVNKGDQAGKFYKAANPHAVEQSVWKESDNVIEFAVEHPAHTYFKKDMTAIDLLKSVKTVYENWIVAGDRGARPGTHNVSNTISVAEHEWEDVFEYIYNNRQSFGGISLLSASGDTAYRQAAYMTVKDPEELIKEYGEGAMFASGLIVDIYHVFGNLFDPIEIMQGIQPSLECSERKPIYDEYGKIIGMTQEECDDRKFDEIKDLAAKRDIVRRMRKFKQKYFNGDINTLSECIKYVDALHKYTKLKRDTVKIDWAKQDFEQSYVDALTLSASACAGGNCDII